MTLVTGAWAGCIPFPCWHSHGSPAAHTLTTFLAPKQAVGMARRPGASTATGSNGRKRYKRPSYLTGFI